MQLDKLLHGGDYNPEQWLDRPDILAKDVELMEKAHVNVVTLGVFSWSPSSRRRASFTWIGWRTSSTTYTPTASPPFWPRPAPHARPGWPGSTPRCAVCAATACANCTTAARTTATLRRSTAKKVAIIDRKLAERFGDDPAVILWHIGNEFGGECHCELCQNAFRAWLQKRYGSLDALNKAWNATFWSHNYTEWSQIESPAPHGENAVQGLALDWKRFVSYQSIDFYKWERDCVRELAPKAEFTVNMMYRFNDINYFDFAKEIDVASWDNYPTWHKPTETIEETALDTAMMHDLYYSLKGKPFLMMESSPSFTNWQPVSKQKRPGIAELSALQAVAHGSDSVCYFQWRASRGAEEKLHGAVVGHDGREDARPFRETAEVGETLEQLAFVADTRRVKQAAIVHDWENKWALEGSCAPRNCGLGYWKELACHYNALARRGITVDFVNQESDLTGYGLVIVPMQYLLRNKFAQALCDYTAQGGTVVVTYWTGVVDESDLCYLGDTPYGLTDLLGLRREEIDALYDGETCHCAATDDGAMEADGSILCEVAAPERHRSRHPADAVCGGLLRRLPRRCCACLWQGPGVLPGQPLQCGFLQ